MVADINYFFVAGGDGGWPCSRYDPLDVVRDGSPAETSHPLIDGDREAS